MPSLMSFKYEDADGQTMTVAINIDITGLTLAQITDGMTTFATLLDPLVDGALVEWNLNLQPPIPTGTFRDTPVAGSDVEKGALITWKLDGLPNDWSIYFPTWKKFVVGTDTVDLADADVALFTSSFQDGIGVTGGGTLYPYNRYEIYFDEVRRGRKDFRK